MLYTLADARIKVAPFVQNGTCALPLIDEKINDALERLLDMQDWECLKRQVRISVTGKTFALPYNAEKILMCDLDGTPSSVFGQAYQYIASGPGELDSRGVRSVFQDLMDLGDYWPYMYDIPTSITPTGSTEAVTLEGMKLAAFSSTASDASVGLTIVGTDDSGDEVTEAVTIQSWPGAEGVWSNTCSLSTASFSGITRITKAATTGYVNLYAVYPTTGQLFLLARYHPSQLRPQFRRFRITNSTVDSTAVVLALVRLRHVPLVDPNDLLPVDNLQALRLAVMALEAEENKDFNTADATMTRALAAMQRRETANTMTKGTPAILDMGYRMSLGRRMNRGIIL